MPRWTETCPFWCLMLSAHSFDIDEIEIWIQKWIKSGFGWDLYPYPDSDEIGIQSGLGWDLYLYLIRYNHLRHLIWIWSARPLSRKKSEHLEFEQIYRKVKKMHDCHPPHLARQRFAFKHRRLSLQPHSAPLYKEKPLSSVYPWSPGSTPTLWEIPPSGEKSLRWGKIPRFISVYPGLSVNQGGVLRPHLFGKCGS